MINKSENEIVPNKKLMIRIAAEKLPSKQYSISFNEPTYGTYRSARRLYPERDRNPYSVEELMLAQSMQEINDQPLDAQPRDMVDRLEPFPIRDRQFLTVAITEAFFMSKDQAKAAKAIAENLTKQYQPTYRIPKGRFPSPNLSIEFRTPSTGVQFAADQKYTGMAEMGCSLEEFLLAYCLSAVNDVPVEHPKDVISVLDEWDIADVQFAATVFINMFTIDESDMDDAKKLGGELKPKSSAVASELTEDTMSLASRKAIVS